MDVKYNRFFDIPGFVDSDNSDHLLKDFSLSAGSPAIDQGIAVPVWDDFTGVDRLNDSVYDLGAFEYVP